MPGRPNAEKTNQSYQYALCNTWIGENEGEYRTGYTDIGVNQADGAFHKYRFDWHTGDENEEARVEFYFDDVLFLGTILLLLTVFIFMRSFPVCLTSCCGH